jgi:glucose-6-phosphate 1-dehydrogenase
MLPIDPKHVVRGQYTGYRSEAGVDPESDTETFIALKCAIDNWRWAGVPFFLRTGKSGWRRAADHLHCVPRTAQEHVPAGVGRQRARPGPSDLRPADAAKMSLSFYGKRPGPACGSTS